VATTLFAGAAAIVRPENISLEYAKSHSGKSVYRDEISSSAISAKRS